MAKAPEVPALGCGLEMLHIVPVEHQLREAARAGAESGPTGAGEREVRVCGSRGGFGLMLRT